MELSELIQKSSEFRPKVARNNKMTVSRLFCGLGNQIFQYAAGLALAHRRNTVLKLDVSWFSEGNAEANHERYGLDCFCGTSTLPRRRS